MEDGDGEDENVVWRGLGEAGNVAARSRGFRDVPSDKY